MNIIKLMIATDIISCTASVATAVIAGMALYAWKREFIGKKKIELAAEIMRAVYDIQDLYIGVRMPMIAQTEHDEARNSLHYFCSNNYTTKRHFFPPLFMCNWHRNFLQGIYDAWFLADLAYGAIYTGNIIAKNRLKQGKKEHPVGLPRDASYSWRRRRDYFAALHHLAKFAHARKPAYSRPPFCGGSNPCPRVRIHIIKHNKKHARWA